MEHGVASRRALLQREPNRNWLELRASSRPRHKQVSRVVHNRKYQRLKKLQHNPRFSLSETNIQYSFDTEMCAPVQKLKT
jgi:hypothetical protein